MDREPIGSHPKSRFPHGLGLTKQPGENARGELQMARRQLTEKEKLYAKVILDLANAKDTNQAGLQYIENIQQAFGLPDEFKHGLRETFPVQPDAKEFVNNIMRHIENIKMEIIEKGGFDVRQTGFTSFTYKEYTLIFGERRAFDVLISSNGSPIVSKMDLR